MSDNWNKYVENGKKTTIREVLLRSAEKGGIPENDLGIFASHDAEGIDAEAIIKGPLKVAEPALQSEARKVLVI